MRRVGLTVLSMAWIIGAIVGWASFGTTIHDHIASVMYWVLSWIPACIVIVAPFVIYSFIED